MKKMFRCSAYALLCMLMLSALCLMSQAADDNLETVSYYAAYGQTDARSMLSMINEFRTGDEAWYWNSDNKIKTYCKNLQPLTYDYELEKIAMQRAAEIAISFSHTRPNGEMCFSLYPDSYIYCGENIAAGYSTAADVMKGWKETDLPYEGQGHRRNMLEENFNAVGVARVYFGGTYYWVQEFGYTENTTEKTDAANYSKRVDVDVDFTGADYTVTVKPETMKLKCGVIKAWPTVNISFRLPSAWPSVYTKATVVTELAEVEGKRIIFTREDGICAMGEGDSKLVANVLGKDYEIDVRCDHSYYDTYVVYETCTTEGSVIVACPCGAKYDKSPPPLGHNFKEEGYIKAPTCTEPGVMKSVCKRCSEEKQEEVAALGHSQKTDSKKATLTADGYKKVYCTVCEEVFEDEQYTRVKTISLSNTKYVYDGKAKKPTVTVKDKNGETLKKDEDYTVEYASGRKRVGKYSVKIKLKGNYSGSKTLSFTILPGVTENVTATQTADSVTLKWDKVKGATGYRVYVYNAKKEKYETLVTAKGNSYTAKNLKDGTSYKFAVKAYTSVDGKTYWAASSNKLTVSTKTKAPAVKFSASSQKVTLSWGKVKGATGYIIYIRNSEGKYERIGSTKKTSYTVTDLGYGQKYYFRVRAYKTSGGKTVYGYYNTYSVTVPYPAVYVTPSGKRYHYSKSCAGKNATKTTFENAKRTRTACKTCVI